jgi:hypothetical protein
VTKCHVGRRTWVRSIRPSSIAAPSDASVGSALGDIRWEIAQSAPGTSWD